MQWDSREQTTQLLHHGMNLAAREEGNKRHWLKQKAFASRFHDQYIIRYNKLLFGWVFFSLNAINHLSKPLQNALTCWYKTSPPAPLPWFFPYCKPMSPGGPGYRCHWIQLLWWLLQNYVCHCPFHEHQMKIPAGWVRAKLKITWAVSQLHYL